MYIEVFVTIKCYLPRVIQTRSVYAAIWLYRRSWISIAERQVHKMIELMVIILSDNLNIFIKRVNQSMTTFNTYDYDFLTKCLSEGSLVFKAESIKRLTTLAVNDKKQFLSSSKQVLSALQQLLVQEKQDINILATILLSEMLINIVSKDNQYIARTKLLKNVVENLGHGSKPGIRKASHTCLLAYIKTYHNFDNLISVYLNSGLQHESYLIRQKSMNSFQSILLLQVKHYNWISDQSKAIFQNLLINVTDNNPYISKAAAQCLLSMCKCQGITQLAKTLSYAYLTKLKMFLEDTVAKIPSTQCAITVEGVQQLINALQKKPNKMDTLQVSRDSLKQKQKEEQARSAQRTASNDAHQRRLQKIKKSISSNNQQKKAVTISGQYNGKMFGNINTEGSLKERTEAAEQLLYKIQMNKNKPQFQSSVKHIIPSILKMLRDTNPKIVGISLKILQSIIQETKGSEFSGINNLASIIVEKLGDQKISIRQMVSKVIKQLAKKTEKGIWIKQLLDNLRRNTNIFLKDETLTLIHYFYEEFELKEINYNHQNLLDQIVVFTEDPKTKIKIRTLDCLSQIAFKTSVENCHSFLKNKMSQVFYQMYTQKVARLVHQRDKKQALQQQRCVKKQRLQQQNSYKTAYAERGSIIKREQQRSEYDEPQQLNVSIDVVRKRVSHLKKPRNIMSTQETISLDNTQRTIEKTIQDVEMMLPSIYKKTHTNRFTMHKGDFSPTKTIQHKSSSDYLSKEQLKPLREPQKQFKNILIDLKSTDWKVQFQTINKLRRLNQFNPQMIISSNTANTHAMVLDLLGLIESLRSSVSKNALICLNQLIMVMNRQIDPQMEKVMEKLMKKSADTSIFISSEVQKCLFTLATRASQAKVIQKLMTYKESKSHAIKQACLSTLLIMKGQQRIRQKQFAKLTQCFSLFLTQGQQQLRAKARIGIVQICQKLGDWYRILRGKMNPGSFKAVCQLMTRNNGRVQYDLNISQTQVPRSQNRSELKTIDVVENQGQSIRASSVRRQQKSRSKFVKVTQFPQEFAQIQPALDESNSSDWKKRTDALNRIKRIALKYENQFAQYRSGSHFIDIMSKQMIEPNLKVSTNALQAFLQIVEPLKPLVTGNINVIATSIFSCMSNNRLEIKELGQKCTEALIENVQISVILQHICHGIMFSLPKSRIYLVNKLKSLVAAIYSERKQLLFKHVFPTLNKLMDQYKADLMPHVINLFNQLYELMGNNMFSHLAKFKQVRELLAK